MTELDGLRNMVQAHQEGDRPFLGSAPDNDEDDVVRYRRALERIAHPDPDEAAFFDYNVAEEIALEALR